MCWEHSAGGKESSRNEENVVSVGEQEQTEGEGRVGRRPRDGQGEDQGMDQEKTKGRTAQETRAGGCYSGRGARRRLPG